MVLNRINLMVRKYFYEENAQVKNENVFIKNLVFCPFTLLNTNDFGRINENYKK